MLMFNLPPEILIIDLEKFKFAICSWQNVGLRCGILIVVGLGEGLPASTTVLVYEDANAAIDAVR
jgi:hypothetical protein